MVLWRGKGRHLSVHFDHLLPHGAGGRDHPDNIVAACSVCNQIKGGLVFETFAAARLHVLTELEKRNVILLSEAECKPVPDLTCERCGDSFLSYHSRARFCSNRCRYDQYDEENPRFSIKGGQFKTREQRHAEEDAAWARLVGRTYEAEKTKQERIQRTIQKREEAERQAQRWRDFSLAHAEKCFRLAQESEDPKRRQHWFKCVEDECRREPWLKEHFPWTKLSNTAVRRHAL